MPRFIALARATRVLVAVFFSLSIPSWGTTPDTLTLAEALEFLNGHPLFMVAGTDEAAATQRARDAGVPPHDAVEFELEPFSGSFPGFRRVESALTIFRPLRDHRRLSAAHAQAAIPIATARSGKRRLVWEVSSSVQEAFHRAFIAQELASVAEEALVVARDLEHVTTERLQAGAAPERELLRSILEVQRAQIECERQDAAVAESRAALAAELGMTTLPPGSLSAVLPLSIVLPDREQLWKNILAHHPELEDVSLGLQNLAARRQTAEADRRPAYRLGFGLRGEREEKKWGLALGVEAELPRRGTNQGELAALEIEKQRFDHVRTHLLRRLENELNASLTSFERHLRVGLYVQSKILPAVEELLDLALEAYQLGKADLLTVLEARRAVIETRRDKWQAIGEVFRALNAIERMCGICLVGEDHHRHLAAGEN